VSKVWTLTMRELGGYFVTPLAYVFIVIFLVLAGVVTFNRGQLFELEQADLGVFFQFHPWLHLFLIPAIAMRLWAEERRSGSIELLMTLPVPLWSAIVGKFLAAWVFASLAILLTFPIWITVSVLGDPDHGTIVAGYIASILVAGVFLAIGSAVSAATRSQVIAFVLTAVVCLALLLLGYQPITAFFEGWAPVELVEWLVTLSALPRFESLSAGLIEARDVVYFASAIAGFLAVTGVILSARESW
jgi:ABC-2 type transport system permease protein